jgi:hypothetical protein
MKLCAKLFRGLSAIVLLAIVALSLTGCPGGGGGGGGTLNPPAETVKTHTDFIPRPAYVNQTGLSYTTSVEFYETRGDEIHFNRMYTYRTFADTYNSGKTSNFYSAGPAKVQGWMFAPQGTTNRDIRDAYIEDSSIAPNMLKGYEHRTIRTSVMIGKEFQSKPAGFNGMFIPWATYRQWALSGYPGVRYWITLEGYDYKLDDDYNIYVPIEIMFPSNLDAQGDYPVNIGDDDDTNPYDAL